MRASNDEMHQKSLTVTQGADNRMVYMAPRHGKTFCCDVNCSPPYKPSAKKPHGTRAAQRQKREKYVKLLYTPARSVWLSIRLWKFDLRVTVRGRRDCSLRYASRWSGMFSWALAGETFQLSALMMDPVVVTKHDVGCASVVINIVFLA